MANTLDTSCNQGIAVKVNEDKEIYAIWYEKYQCYIAIRKLTPKECFRLQGWDDESFQKAEFVNSNSQLYKQARQWCDSKCDRGDCEKDGVSMARGKNKPVIDLQDDNFGAMLNWAVRYCLGRMSYAPGQTIAFITPLLPYLSRKTLWCFDRDIEERKKDGWSFGMDFDEEAWMRFWDKVKEEIGRREANE